MEVRFPLLWREAHMYMEMCAYANKRRHISNQCKYWL